MCLTLSESFSVAHLLIATFSFVASIFILLAIPFPEDLYTFVLASVLMSVTITYFVVGLSTWLATPSAGDTRWDVLLFVLSIFWSLTVALLIAIVFAYPRYMGEKILGYFNPNIYEDDELLQIKISLILGVVATAVIILSNLALTVVIMYKHFLTDDDL